MSNPTHSARQTRNEIVGAGGAEEDFFSVAERYGTVPNDLLKKFLFGGQFCQSFANLLIDADCTVPLSVGSSWGEEWHVADPREPRRLSACAGIRGCCNDQRD